MCARGGRGLSLLRATLPFPQPGLVIVYSHLLLLPSQFSRSGDLVGRSGGGSGPPGALRQFWMGWQTLKMWKGQSRSHGGQCVSGDLGQIGPKVGRECGPVQWLSPLAPHTCLGCGDCVGRLRNCLGVSSGVSKRWLAPGGSSVPLWSLLGSSLWSCCTCGSRERLEKAPVSPWCHPFMWVLLMDYA